LDTIPGLDFRRGLAGAGRVETYARLLRQFADRHRRDARLVAGALAQDDSDEAVRIVHALRGAAYSLGAIRVGEAATELETGIVEGTASDVLEHRCTALASSLAELTAGIDAALGIGGDADGPPSQVEVERLPTVLKRLKGLLASGDMEASALARAEQALLREGLGAEAESLLELIGQFDFEGALAVLNGDEPAD
jgi:two-component system sensor histidine kinase/response regulator